MYTLDASTVVAGLFSNEANHTRAKRTLTRIRNAGAHVIVPELLLPEVSAAISRGTNTSRFAQQFCGTLRAVPEFVFVPVDQNISDLSVMITARYKLRGPDAVYVAVAYKFGATLITYDKEQKERGGKLVEVIEELE